MSAFDRWKGRRSIPFLLFGMVLALIVSRLPPAASVDRAVYDHLLALTDPVGSESRIAVIGVDDASLARFPEPIALWHPHWAQVLEGVGRSGVAGIAMDMVFAISLENIAPAMDGQLMEALQSCKAMSVPVYLGIATGPFAQMSHPKFSIFASGLGYLNLSADSDEMVRRQILTQTNANGKRLMALSRLLVNPSLPPETRDATEIFIDYRLPLPPVHSFAEVHHWVTEGRSDRLSAAFKDKFVLLGFQSMIFQDLHPVPTPIAPADHRLLPGLMIHGQIAQTLLTGDLLKEAPPAWTIFLSILLGILSGAAFARRPPLGAVAALGFLIIAVGLGMYQLFRFGIVAPAGTLLSFAVMPGVTVGLHQFISEHRQRRVLQNYFGKYVHPRVVENILQNPSRIDFEGESVTLTVMFTDIRNFTTLCEHRDPVTILKGLNRYFDVMSETITDAGGYLNRTVGDGILALFGAPLPLREDGAWAAVRCGLDMLKRLEMLNREDIFPGAGPVEIGIGIHTGAAIVGNVGSQRKLEYSIVGDTANLAARVESLTKTYGEPFLASGEAVSRIRDRVESRHLDTTLVKGRDQAVDIFAIDGIGNNGKEEK